MVRVKNALSVLMQCFAIAALVTVLWVAYGYSLAFDDARARSSAGSARHSWRASRRSRVVGTIPESVFATFQMTFAIITPALIVGAFAERMKFGALLVFVALWFTFIYAPLAHMVWSGPGALMWDWGVLDFAGGTVVHVNAGIAGLVAALVIGRRHGYPGRGDARRTTCPSRWSARRCCGSAGSASTPAARSPRTARPAWRCSSRRSRPPPRRSPGWASSGRRTASRARSASRPARSPASSRSRPRPAPPAPRAHC